MIKWGKMRQRLRPIRTLKRNRKGSDMAKKMIVLLIAVMFALVVFNYNARCQYSQFMSGSQLMEDWQLYQSYQNMKSKGETSKIDTRTMVVAAHFIGYVTGVADARSSILHVPDGVTSAQLCSIVGQYLEAHPNEWHENGADLIVKAIRNAFQKK
jgi:hypothetical protein